MFGIMCLITGVAVLIATLIVYVVQRENKFHEERLQAAKSTLLGPEANEPSRWNTPSS